MVPPGHNDVSEVRKLALAHSHFGMWFLAYALPYPRRIVSTSKASLSFNVQDEWVKRGYMHIEIDLCRHSENTIYGTTGIRPKSLQSRHHQLINVRFAAVS